MFEKDDPRHNDYADEKGRSYGINRATAILMLFSYVMTLITMLVLESYLDGGPYEFFKVFLRGKEDITFITLWGGLFFFVLWVVRGLILRQFFMFFDKRNRRKNNNT